MYKFAIQNVENIIKNKVPNSVKNLSIIKIRLQ